MEEREDRVISYEIQEQVELSVAKTRFHCLFAVLVKFNEGCVVFVMGSRSADRDRWSLREYFLLESTTGRTRRLIQPVIATPNSRTPLHLESRSAGGSS
jgi:hypothetical protein